MFWRVQWLLATTILLVIAMAWGLALTYGFLLPAKPVDVSVLLESARMFVAPEPTERFVFVVLLLLVPLLVAGLVLGGAFRSLSISGGRPRRLDVLLTASLGLLIYLAFYLAPFSRVLMGWVGLQKPGAEKLTLLALALALLWVWILLRGVGRGTGHRRFHSMGRGVIGAVVGCGVVGSLFVYRVFDFSRLTGSAVWSDHLDAVSYPISQVLAGRTLLADLPSQYGLFPELLAFPFRLLPVSLFSLTLVYGALQIISMLALLSVLWRHVRSPLLLAVVSLSLVMVTFGTSGASGFRFTEPDPYFQYWPVRFVWPALSVFWFDRFLRHPCRQNWLLPLLGTAIAVIWNLDSGLAVLYAGSMTMFSMAAMQGCRQASRDGIDRPPGGRRMVRFWMMAAVALPLVSLAGLVLFLGLLMVKAGAPLHMDWLGAYQATFYGLGFFMIPLPLPIDAWMAILAIYVLGMLVSLVSLSAGKDASWAGIVLYLSVLGAGLFIYYQGRSHFFNLVSVAWPAFLTGGILTDRYLRALSHRLVPASSAWMPAFGLGLLLLPALGLLAGIPEQWKLALAGQAPASTRDRAVLQSELALIRRHCSRGTSCLILAKRQGIYALEAGLPSPWQGPGLSELLLTRDRDRLVRALLDGRYEHVFLGVGPVSSLEGLNLPTAAILRRYQRIDESNSGSLLYLQPRAGRGWR